MTPVYLAQAERQKNTTFSIKPSCWLIVCSAHPRFNSYPTGILGKRISCITAHTMVRQLVSGVKASI